LRGAYLKRKEEGDGKEVREMKKFRSEMRRPSLGV
jgi:hypothetical protein